MRVYLAHQITGLGYAQVMEYYDGVSAWLRENTGHTVLCPMVAKDYLKDQQSLESNGYQFPTSTNHAIFERDKWMVQQADIVLVDLVGQSRPAVGCLMELAWASLLGKHTIVVMESGSPYHHAFVLEAADIVFGSLQEALVYLGELRF